MTTSVAAVRFKRDGLIMYTTYNNTADVLRGELFEDWVPTKTPYSERKCTCGQAEEAEAASWSLSWDVTACRHCKAVVTGQAPYGIYGYGYEPLVKPAPEIRHEPDWWKEITE